ncbi:MAG: hypothetical protein KKB50_03610 [Planctomycetes bacterium]|nr:hypothetical protein [Planctomycetota bacterium]
MRLYPSVVLLLAAVLVPAPASADFTNNIMITGYWPPTNEMVRPFSDNPEQNPGGWIGGDWEGLGYDIYSFFPEFPSGSWPKGVGDFEVDYQDTSADFWRIVAEVEPVAIITFSRGSINRDWEIEKKQRNLAEWVDDYEAPYQPTPAPPDDSVPADYERISSLPMWRIRDWVNDANIGVEAMIDYNGYGGGFLSEFIAYHGCWYHDLHSDPSDPAWNVAAGHIHVSERLTLDQATAATEITLRALIDYVDQQVPEPSSALLLVFGVLAVTPRRALR